MTQSIENLISEVDRLIRSAQLTEAKAKIKAFPFKEVPSTELWKIAALARRANLPEISIHLLRPIVRPSKKMRHAAQDEDLCEYGGALLRLEACQEATALLQKVDPQKVPEALLFLGILSMKNWDYLHAAKFFRNFLGQQISDYSRLVGKMNLAACFLYDGPYEEAKSLLQEVVENTSGKEGFLLLQANATRLLGNLELNRHYLQAALGYFQQGENLLASVGGLEHFFSRKWLAITEYLIRPSHEDGLFAIEREATQKQHWETLRHIDYYRALVTKDPKIIHRLFVGTPLPHFKEQLLKTFPNTKIPETYLLHVGSETGSSFKQLDTRKLENLDPR